MSFAWVRRIEQVGNWSDSSITLVLKSGRLAPLGYFFVAVIVTLGFALPIGAAASVGLGLPDPVDKPAVSALSWLQVTAAGALACAAVVWLSHCSYRSAFLNPKIVIENGYLELSRPRLFGTDVSRTPLSAYEGLAVLAQSTLDGRSYGLFLLHPDRRLSPLLMLRNTIDEATLRNISDAIGVPVVASAQSRRAPAALPTPDVAAGLSAAA